jgi:septal ring factor EnvC (AmiA/AmiB activator)
MNVFNFDTVEQWLIVFLCLGYVCMFVYVVFINKHVKRLEKQNAIEHSKLYKNQKSITNELLQILTIVRNIKDDVKSNSSLLKKKIDDYSDTNKIIKSLKQNLENEQKKLKSTEHIVSTLINKLQGLSDHKNNS